jgi:hypothetical protein
VIENQSLVWFVTARDESQEHNVEDRRDETVIELAEYPAIITTEYRYRKFGRRSRSTNRVQQYRRRYYKVSYVNKPISYWKPTRTLDVDFLSQSFKKNVGIWLCKPGPKTTISIFNILLINLPCRNLAQVQWHYFSFKHINILLLNKRSPFRQNKLIFFPLQNPAPIPYRYVP